MQQFKREDPFCLAPFFLLPLLFPFHAGGRVSEKLGMTHKGTIAPPMSYLVQLHLAREGPAGTPVDQYLTGEDGAFELLAPPGEYLLR